MRGRDRDYEDLVESARHEEEQSQKPLTQPVVLAGGRRFMKMTQKTRHKLVWKPIGIQLAQNQLPPD
ncbi:hypothetical protein J6590_008054 [Homalodisca vitripennis]|nr:hypothetical protein J6590_008054 [Homalodisca vitripennis]